jgi:S1-C subfamily serine protease
MTDQRPEEASQQAGDDPGRLEESPELAPSASDTQRYAPAPEPRGDWTRPSWSEPPLAPPPWSPDPRVERSRAEHVAGRPVTEPVGRPAGRGAGVGTVLAAAMLSAVLASGGTYFALDASGALDRTSAPQTPGIADPVATRLPLMIDESSAIIDAAARVSPAVVQLTAAGASMDLFGDLVPNGVGSGVIFDADGWILTNRHVVRQANGELARSLTVRLKDGREFPGTIYGIDTLTDLAIVRIDGTDLTPAPIGDSGNLRVGQLTIAIGSPLGTYTNSVTSGIVSATGRRIVVDGGQQLTNLIQTDAAINPGNSGGPLLDAAGNVIGINTAIARNSSGIGFAIPINIARPIMQQALAGEALARPYIGIRYEAIDIQMARAERLPVEAGALVRGGRDANGRPIPGLVEDGPAASAGVREGDIILSIEEQPIDAEHPLDAVLSQFAPGAVVELEILRGSERLTIPVTLGTRPENLG